MIRTAAALLVFTGIGFGVFCVPAMRSVHAGRGFPIVFGFPAYGGGPFERVGIPTTVALLSAIVILFALWASLGQGHWLLRYSLLLGVLLGLGAAVGGASTYGERFLNQWVRANGYNSSFDYDLFRWYEVGWWWIAWMFLSGGLLAASLMIFRTVGYRLVRRGTTSRRSVASAS